MLRWNKSADGGSRGHHLKQVHAPEGALPPGKLPVHKMQWWADPVALRRATEGVVFCGLLLLFGAYGFRIYFGVTEAASRKSCADNLKAIAVALHLYALDHEGAYPPPGGDFARQMFPYLPEMRYLCCPSDDLARPQRRRRGPTPIRISYTYRPSFRVSPDFCEDPSQSFVAWDVNGGVRDSAHKQGGNVLYGDGHCRWLPMAYWAAADQPYAQPPGAW